MNFKTALTIFTLLFLVSCASHTSQEEAQYNNDEAGMIVHESPATFR